MKSIQCILLASSFLLAVSVSAQKSTEMFIPLGKSPGLSGKYTLMGTVEGYNAQDSTLTIMGDNGSATIKLKGQPKVWLDYSPLKLPNKTGSFTDFLVGLRVECKFVSHEKQETLDWIKVEMKAPN